MVNQFIFEIPELFDTPKPIELLSHLINISSQKNAIILDFFSGSSTTAHAVMQLNAEDGGNRKIHYAGSCPKCAIPIPKAARQAIKQFVIGKERIRRAGAKITEEQKAKNNGMFAEDANH